MLQTGPRGGDNGRGRGARVVVTLAPRAAAGCRGWLGRQRRGAGAAAAVLPRRHAAAACRAASRRRALAAALYSQG